MALDLAWAFLAALLVGVAGLTLKRPRAVIASWAARFVRRVQLRLYLQRREDTQRAIERIAAELAQRRCDQEGNPDEDFYGDWYRWFTGDPDANVDYSRKQERDRERLRRGDFNI